MKGNLAKCTYANEFYYLIQLYNRLSLQQYLFVSLGSLEVTIKTFLIEKLKETIIIILTYFFKQMKKQREKSNYSFGYIITV